MAHLKQRLKAEEAQSVSADTLRMQLAALQDEVKVLHSFLHALLRQVSATALCDCTVVAFYRKGKKETQQEPLPGHTCKSKHSDESMGTGPRTQNSYSKLMLVLILILILTLKAMLSFERLQTRANHNIHDANTTKFAEAALNTQHICDISLPDQHGIAQHNTDLTAWRMKCHV